MTLYFWYVRGSVDASEKDNGVNEEEEVKDSEEGKVNGNTTLLLKW